MRNVLRIALVGFAAVSGVTAFVLWRNSRDQITTNAGSPIAVQNPSIPEESPAPPQPTLRESFDHGQSVQRPASATAADQRRGDSAFIRPGLSTSRGMRQSYPGLVEALGLSEEEAERFWQLLSENQLAGASGIPMINGKVDADAIRANAQNRSEAQRQLNASIAAMLGPARLQQWKDYQETLPGRQQSAQVGSTLQSAGLPLSSQQMGALTDTMIAENKRLLNEMAPRVGTTGVAASDPAAMQEERLRSQAESNRRIVESASTYLTPPQAAALRTALEQRLARSQGSMSSLQRAFSESQQHSTTTN
jgi:hypothetical protein